MSVAHDVATFSDEAALQRQPWSTMPSLVPFASSTVAFTLLGHVTTERYNFLGRWVPRSMASGRSVAEMVGDGTSHRLRYAANARSGWAVSVHSVDAGHPPLRRHSRGVTVGAPLGSMRHDRGVTHSPPTSSDKKSASGAEEDAARHRGEQVASMLYEHRREEKH